MCILVIYLNKFAHAYLLIIARCCSFYTLGVAIFLIRGQIKKGLKKSWWPSCLDCGALINVEAPGCGTSVVQGQTGYK